MIMCRRAICEVNETIPGDIETYGQLRAYAAGK